MDSKTLAIVAVVAVMAVGAGVAAFILLDSGKSDDPDPYADCRYEFLSYDHATDSNLKLKAYYEDSYFDKKSTEKNPELMSFALCLQLSSGLSADDPKDKPTSVLKLLKDIGCTKVYANDAYYEESTLISLDVAVGAKKYNKDTTLVFLVPNGTHYSTQFASNLLVGASGDHEGFSKAAVTALYTLKDFIKSEGITGNVKLLVTGYSRSAAATNILTAFISDSIVNGTVKEDIGNINLTIDSVYGFCFETPFCGYIDEGDVGPTDSRYDNIWYTVNPADLVTYVPPESYGFVRYGHMVTIPSEDMEKKAIMEKIASKIYSKATADVITLPEFVVMFDDVASPHKMVKGLVVLFFKVVGDRDYYSENIEPYMVTALYSLMCHPGMFADIVDELGGYIEMVTVVYTKCDTPEFDDYVKPAISVVTEKYGCEEDTDNIVNALKQIGLAAKRLIDPELLTDHSLLTLPWPKNYKYPITSHYPAMTFGYVVQEDPHYDIYH